MEKYQTLFRKIMSDYPEYEYRIEKCATQCLTDENPIAILFNKEDYENCTEEDVFDLLHEIGHARTNSDHNARCVREFEATKWAVAHAPEYGIKISEKRKKDFPGRCILLERYPDKIRKIYRKQTPKDVLPGETEN